MSESIEFLTIALDRRKRATFCFWIPCNLMSIVKIVHLTVGVQMLDLLVTFGYLVILAIVFNPEHKETHAKAYIGTALFAPLVVRILASMVAIWVSSIVDDGKKEVKVNGISASLTEFKEKMVETMKLWLLVMIQVQLFMLAAHAALLPLVLNENIPPGALKIEKRFTVVYGVFLALLVIMTCVNVVATFYFWRCILYYYLGLVGFWSDGNEEDASTDPPEQSQNTKESERNSSEDTADIVYEVDESDNTKISERLEAPGRHSGQSNEFNETADDRQEDFVKSDERVKENARTPQTRLRIAPAKMRNDGQGLSLNQRIKEAEQKQVGQDKSLKLRIKEKEEKIGGSKVWKKTEQQKDS